MTYCLPAILTQCKRSEEMKKFLSVAVALGMVAGVAATASALELKTKGLYKVDGYWIDGASSSGVAISPDATDSDWFQHTFKVNADLIVNDKITIKSDIRFIDSNTMWQDKGGTNNGGYFDVNKLWMVYKSPVGKFEIGRRPAGAWGLPFVSSGTNADRLFWHLPTGDGPMKAYVFTQKFNENDYAGGVDSDSPFISGFNGGDKDYYELGVGHKAKGMTIYGGLGTLQQDSVDYSMYRLKFYGVIAAGPGNLVFETDYKTGDASANVDINSYAAMLGYMGSAGNISYMAGVATITGDNDSDASENSAYDPKNGTGADFEPLYILTGNRTNVLNGDRGADPVGSAVRQSGVVAAVATADYKASEDLTLHGGFGWGMADDAPAGWDDDYGIELDFGVAYKLYQNLTYDLHLGYWMVGDFGDMGGANEAEDVMLLSNHLTMKF